MEKELTIAIGPDGSVEFIYDDALADVFDGFVSETRRASHVEPIGGGWFADLSPVGGPVLYASGPVDGRTHGLLLEVFSGGSAVGKSGLPKPFATRAAALEAEVAWLQANRGL